MCWERNILKFVFKTVREFLYCGFYCPLSSIPIPFALQPGILGKIVITKSKKSLICAIFELQLTSYRSPLSLDCVIASFKVIYLRNSFDNNANHNEGKLYTGYETSRNACYAKIRAGAIAKRTMYCVVRYKLSIIQCRYFELGGQIYPSAK